MSGYGQQGSSRGSGQGSNNQGSNQGHRPTRYEYRSMTNPDGYLFDPSIELDPSPADREAWLNRGTAQQQLQPPPTNTPWQAPSAPVTPVAPAQAYNANNPMATASSTAPPAHFTTGFTNAPATAGYVPTGYVPGSTATASTALANQDFTHGNNDDDDADADAKAGTRGPAKGRGGKPFGTTNKGKGNRCERCLLQHKKCDEVQPVCGFCAGLDKPCFWPPYPMSRGALVAWLAAGNHSQRPGPGYPVASRPPPGHPSPRHPNPPRQ